MKNNHFFTKGTSSFDEIQFLEDHLYEYNAAKVGCEDGQSFSFLIRDENQVIVAGLYGWTWAQACEIKALWVHAAWRGQGYGTQLLEAAEREACSHGCKIMMLNSYSFQAPGFYQKCGFTLVWQLSDFPPGQQLCVLIKQLIDIQPPS